ncbi:MAG: hypothetical protein L3K26_08485 [Candidatus Hydrogenedentes bacterium]|nr:hypothetical protein [Candidatus Hydrogenedentota bacterium]
MNTRAYSRMTPLVSLLWIIALAYWTTGTRVSADADIAPDFLQEELPKFALNLPALSEEAEQARQSALSEIRSGDILEAQHAIKQLLTSEVRFARNCTDTLNAILARRSRAGVGAAGVRSLFLMATAQIPALPEGEYKTFVIDKFFTFLQEAELSVEDRLGFSLALHPNIFLSNDGISVIPEYGGVKIIGTFAEYLTNEDAEIRYLAAGSLARIGVLYAEMRGIIASLLEERLPREEADRALHAMNSQVRPEYDGIKASEYEQLRKLSAPELVDLMVNGGAPRHYLQQLLMGNDERVKANYQLILDVMRNNPKIHLGWNAPLQLAIPVENDASPSEKERVDAVLDYYEEVLRNVKVGKSAPMWLPEAFYRCAVLTGKNGRPREKDSLSYGSDRAFGLMTELLECDSRTAVQSARRMQKLADVDPAAAIRVHRAFSNRLKELPGSGTNDTNELREALEKGIGELEKSDSASQQSY